MTIGQTKDDQKWMFYEAAFTFPDECFHYFVGSPKFQQSWTPILITLSKYISLYQGRKKLKGQWQEKQQKYKLSSGHI